MHPEDYTSLRTYTKGNMQVWRRFRVSCVSQKLTLSCMFWDFSAFKLIQTSNTGLRLSLTGKVSHAFVRAVVNHRPITTRH